MQWQLSDAMLIEFAWDISRFANFFLHYCSIIIPNSKQLYYYSSGVYLTLHKLTVISYHHYDNDAWILLSITMIITIISIPSCMQTMRHFASGTITWHVNHWYSNNITIV